MPVSPARAAAFDILLRVERESSYASELLHSAAYQGLSTPDHGLATELVMGVLRWRSLLDIEISKASSQPLSKLDLEILIALRLALYQFGWLDRIPKRAALHESVELVKRARKRSAATFVNAVLRKLSTQSLRASVPPVVSSPDELATSSAHPLWLVERWVKEYGSSIAYKICQYNQSIPEAAIRVRSNKAEVELTKEEVSLSTGSILSEARRVNSGDITRTTPFRNRGLVIQDEGSQLVAALVGSSDENARILDCCAAPGGKTLAIADHNPQAAITAVELHPHRARLMQTLFPEDTKIQTVVADARALPFTQPFDRIIVDAPCSGTGTLARNPEIKWRLQPADIDDLQGRQIAILLNALECLTPGGRLVYSTCSLEREENQDVVGKSGAEVLETMQRLPGRDPGDGFFASVLRAKID